MPQIVTGNVSTRKVYILRLWQHAGEPAEWVAELQNVLTGETLHAYGAEALLDLVRQLVPPLPQSENQVESL